MEPNCDSKSRRKCVSEKKYKFVRAIVAALCVMMLALTVVPSATMHAAEDIDDSYDMEAVANSLGTIMSIGSMPVGTDSAEVYGVSVLNGIPNDNAGNAGCVLAYTSKPTSLGQWLASQVSASSMRYDYSSLLNIPTNSDGATTNTVYKYAVYGRALNQLGFDRTATAATASTLPRAIAGYSTLFMYIVANSVNSLFDIALALLQLFNPFAWLDSVSKNYSANLGAQYSANYVSHNVVFDNLGISSILQYIAGLYSTLCNLSWALIIPMSLGLYLANMFLFRKTAGGKRLLKRILFIAIGVPLVGGTYTSFLNEMRNVVNASGGYANTIISSVFIDFEAWASNSHLAPPTSGGTIVVDTPISNWSMADSSDDDVAASNGTSMGGEVSVETQYHIKDLCNAINFANTPGGSLSSTTSMASGLTLDSGNDTFDSTTYTDPEEYDALSKVYSAESDEDVLGLDSLTISSSEKWIINLLFRYATGDVYTSEQYASAIQARMSSLSKGDDDRATSMMKMMKIMSRYKNIPPYNDGDWWGKLASIFTEDSNVLTWESANVANLSDDTSAQITNPSSNLFGSDGIFDDGGLKVSTSGSELTFSGSTVNSNYLKTFRGVWRGSSGRAGLSTMSMYCYLNNEFTSTGVITYGGGSAITNGLTRANHYSVNLIGGNGIMPFVYWLETIILLGCISIIGLMYAIGMFMGTFKYTFKAIGSMPMAVVGSMRYMAKFVGCACAMMANVAVTAFMYCVVVEVLFAIVNVIENNPLILLIARSAGIIGMLIFSGAFYVIVIVWLTGLILRVRKNAVNSVTEWITQIVGKFFEADGHQDPSKPGANIGSKIAGGLAAGAAMTKGAQMASKAGGMLAGALAGDDAGGGGDGGGTGPDGGGSGIEKESQDHFGTDTSSDSQLLGGESTSESETKDASVDKENDSVDKENSEQALIAANNSTHNAVASQSAEHERQQSDSSTHASEESTSATHASEEQSDKKEAKAEAATERDRADKTHDSIAQVSESAAVKEAVSKDTTGTADVVKQNVDAVNNGGQNLKDAGKALAEGDIKGAQNNVKEAGKNVAGAVVADVVVATTGSTQAASAAGHLTDDAAKGNLNAGSVLRATSALSGGATNGVAGQMPGGANGGAKQLGGAAPTDAPKKSLGGADSGQKPSTTSNSQGSPNSGQKQASAVDGGKSTSHTASLKAGGMTVNSNITNNISNGGTINTQNVQQGGPSMNMTNSAGNNVNNTTNVTNNNAGGGGHTVQAVGGGNVVNNSAGRNVQNITNVNNVNNVQNMQRGGGNAGAVNGGKNVQNVTNVNNAQTVNNVNTNSSFENRSRK